MISKIPAEDLAETEVGPSGIISKPQKMLGIPYVPSENAFSFNHYHKLSTNVIDTKIKLTSCLPKLSPNGLILPIIMEGRRCLSSA